MTDSDPNDIDRLRRIVLNRLESLQRAGVSVLPKGRTDDAWLLSAPQSAVSADIAKPHAMGPTSKFDLKPAASPVTSAPPLPRSLAPQDPPMPRPAAVRSTNANNAPLPVNRAERIAALDVLKCEVAQCTLCPTLAKTRTQTVFGVGNPEARVAFFGEAPGADEDRQGVPFVGRAGQLLTKIIEACGFTREDVYILNVLRCRPPENRNPADDEVENCRQWFESTLRVIRPEYLVCVGTVPTKALFPDALAIGKMRGKFYQWQNSKVLCTYHPSYLLRNPEAKKLVWEDMKLLLADMGLEVPKKG
jgi:DNA polymerase